VNHLAALPAIPDAIEAAVRAGRSDQPRGRLAALKSWIETAPADARRAWLARCQALLGLQPPEEALGEALAHADGLTPFKQARTKLMAGEGLRRGAVRW
jgi:hypothetical protein